MTNASRIANVNLATLPDGMDSDLDRLRSILDQRGITDVDAVEAHFIARRLGLAEGGELPMSEALAAIQNTKTRMPLKTAVDRNYTPIVAMR